MSVHIPTWNPLRVHRETWLGRLRRDRRLRGQNLRLESDTSGRDRSAGLLPRFKDPQPFAPAPGPKAPVKTSHVDAAERWNALGFIHGARQSAIGKLKKIDDRLITALGRCTTAREKEGRASAEHARVKTSRADFVAGVPVERHDELERHPSRLARSIPAALWALDTSIMVGPWHLFGAPALPFLSYQGQIAATSFFALLRAALLSLALVAVTKLAGSAARVRVGDREGARRTGDIVLFIGVAVSTVLLIASTARMQGAYIAITTGGFGVHLPNSVFLMITLFVIVASVAYGYWTCSPLAERHARLTGAEERTWQRREKAATELDKRESLVRAIVVERGHSWRCSGSWRTSSSPTSRAARPSSTPTTGCCTASRTSPPKRSRSFGASGSSRRCRRDADHAKGRSRAPSRASRGASSRPRNQSIQAAESSTTTSATSPCSGSNAHRTRPTARSKSRTPLAPSCSRVSPQARVPKTADRPTRLRAPRTDETPQ